MLKCWAVAKLIPRSLVICWLLKTLVELLVLSRNFDACNRFLPSKLCSALESSVPAATCRQFTSRSLAVVVQSMGSEVSMLRRLVAVFLLNPVTTFPEMAACGLRFAAVLTRKESGLNADWDVLVYSASESPRVLRW